MIAPFSRDVERLDEITGVGVTAAQELIAEIGVDVTRFPDAAHLVSWAKFAPIDRNSAGRKRGGSTGKGNPWLAGTLGEIVARYRGPTPSSASATGGWRGGAARAGRSSRSATRC